MNGGIGMESTALKRLRANMELVSRLETYLKNNPDIRFSQALQNLGIVKTTRPVNVESTWVEWQNEFYKEPSEVLERVHKMEQEKT